ncbi:MAG: hypothetical protein IJA32_11705 [Lachnospiraceae bacterium]|nr:hypothetical protein [Lachnospiraceae bacterium]
MSKKSNKLLFLATATAAIGGAMYVFRDKIKESKILENSDENPLKPYFDKGVELKDKAVDFAKEKKLQWDAKKADTNEIVDVDDFSDEIFEENHDREYRTIHITSPEEDEVSKDSTTETATEPSAEVNLTEDIPEVTPLTE